MSSLRLETFSDGVFAIAITLLWPLWWSVGCGWSTTNCWTRCKPMAAGWRGPTCCSC